MNIIFTMCFAGSTLFLSYLFIINFFNGFLCNRWKYIMLKFVLFFFLTPLGFLRLIPHRAMVPVNFEMAGTAPLKVITPQNSYSNITYQIQHTLIIIWLIMAITVFLWQQIKYIHLKKLIQQSITEVTDLDLLLFSTQCQQSMKIRRKVKLFQSDYISPFTTGIFSAIIIIPASLPYEKQKLVLKHELVHVRHYDTLFLFLRHLIACFYWFNPLIYLLESQVEKTVEAYCDETVTLNMGPRERKDYASLIIDLATHDVQYQRTYSPLFSNSATALKERIDLIMTPKKRKKHGKILSIIFAICMVICSSATVFAYQPPTELKMICNFPYNPFTDINASDSISFQSEDYLLGNPSNTILYDYQFTDTSGNIYKISDTDHSNYAACNHNYVKGTISKHSKKNDGSCVTSYYDSQRCSKCGHIIIESLIKTETYRVCPH